MNTTNGMQDNDPTIVIVAALDASEQQEEQRGMKRKVEEKGGGGVNKARITTAAISAAPAPTSTGTRTRASGVDHDHDHENKNELTPAFQEKDGLNNTGTSTGTGTDDGDTMLVSEPVSKEKRTIDENGRSSSSSSSSIGGEDDNDTNNLTIDPDESNLPEGMRLVWNAKKTGAILYIAKNMNNKDNDLSSCISTEHLQNDNNNDNNNNATTTATITTGSTTNNRELRVCLVGRAKCVLLEGAAEILGYDLENNTNVVDDDDYDDDPNQTQNLDRCSHNHHTDRSQTDNPSSSSLASVSLSSSSGVTVTSPYWSSWMTIEANPRLLPCRIALLCIRGYESFKLVPPTRPIVLPSSWRTCADQFVQECTPGRGTNNNNNTTNNKNNYPTDTAVASTGRGGRKLSVVADYLEDYDDDDHHRRENHNQPSKKQCMMILGAKSTGKSTFLRYVTNRLLSSSSSSNTTNTNSFNSTDSKNDGVAILDTDVGCGELAPPGLLRLAIVRKPLLRPPYWNLIDEDTVQNDQQNEKQRTIDDRVVNKDKNDKNKNNNDNDNDNDNDNNIGDDEDNENNNGIQVVSSVFFGSNTSKVDPTRYINAVQFLMDKYETEIVQTNSDRVPLLINMDGWVKGLGYQILTALIENLQPTHLVQIIGESKGQTFEIPMNLSMNPHIYKIPACQSLPEASLCRIPPLTMRNFRWAAYFLPHQLATFDAWDFVPAKELQTGWIVATNSDGTTTVPCSRRRKNDSHAATGGDHNNAEIPEGHEALRDECRLAQSLAKEKPYCVPMESVEAFVIGSDFEDHLRIPPNAIQNTTDIERTRTRIFQALNGSIVALCIDTITMESLGYGILRSIDWNQRLLYVLVPPSVAKTRSSLSQVKALVGGNLQLPLAMLYRGVYAESFPYLTTIPSSSSSIILGSAPMKSRNNIARRGLV